MEHYYKIIMKNNIINRSAEFLVSVILIIFFTSSCGFYKPVDARKVPASASERVKQNIEKGEGFRAKNLFSKKSGDFDFATSNALWRATLDVLDFAPLSNVDYSGGLVITDWFNEKTNKKNSLKITVRFLTNEIRSDAVEVILHKKICDELLECTISKYSGKLNNEIKLAILKKATIMQKSDKEKLKKDSGEYKINNIESSD